MPHRVGNNGSPPPVGVIATEVPVTSGLAGTTNEDRRDVKNRPLWNERKNEVAPTAGIESGKSADGPGEILLVAKLDGADYGLDKSGRLRLGVQPATPENELRAIRELVVRSAAGSNALEQVTDAARLVALAARLKELHADFAQRAKLNDKDLDARQLRSAMLALLRDVVITLRAAKQDAVGAQVAETLAQAIAAEPHRPMRDFMLDSWYRLSRPRPTQGLQSERPALLSHALLDGHFPSRPPPPANGAFYRLQVLCDNSGEKFENIVDFFSALEGTYLFGMTKTVHPDGSVTQFWPGTNGGYGIEVTLQRPPEAKPGEEPQNLLAKLDDPAVDGIIYTGHAGYGHRVDHALAHHVGGTGRGKMLVLLECTGTLSIASVASAFPDAQLLSSTEPSRGDLFDEHLTRQLLMGLRDKKDWDGIAQDVRKDLHQRLDNNHYYQAVVKAQETYDIDNHYFYPNSGSVFTSRLDRDRDGTVDASDSFFRVIYPKRQAAPYDPMPQQVGIEALDAKGLGDAVNKVNLQFLYDEMLPTNMAQKLRWQQGKLVSQGFFVPEAGDLRAFRFIDDPGRDQVRVQLSALFAHTTEQELARMLAYEAGLYYGERAGLPPDERTALALSMLERSLHQQAGHFSPQWLLDEAWANELGFRVRYGLAGLRFADLVATTNDPIADRADGKIFVREHFARVLTYVRSKPELVAAAAKPPQRFGTAIEVPEGIRLPLAGIDAAAIKVALERLGIKDTLVGYSASLSRPSRDMEGSNTPFNIAALVKAADGRLRLVTLGLDGEAVVQAASAVELKAGEAIEHTARQFVVDLGRSEKMGSGREHLPIGELLGVYDAARQAGRAPGQAIAEVLRAGRPLIAPGSLAPDLGTLSRLAEVGLTTRDAWAPAQAELQRSYDQHLIEGAFVSWLTDRSKIPVDAAIRALFSSYGDSNRASAARLWLDSFTDPLRRDTPEVATLYRLAEEVGRDPTKLPALTDALRVTGEALAAAALRLAFVKRLADGGPTAAFTAMLDGLPAGAAASSELQRYLVWCLPEADLKNGAQLAISRGYATETQLVQSLLSWNPVVSYGGTQTEGVAQALVQSAWRQALQRNATVKEQMSVILAAVEEHGGGAIMQASDFEKLAALGLITTAERDEFTRRLKAAVHK